MRLLKVHAVACLTLCACGDDTEGMSPGSSETAIEVPFTVKVNFQPESEPVPSDYRSDVGRPFGDRGGGLSYGWNAENGANARVRHSSRSPDARYDTLIRMQRDPNPNAAWELAVPNGTYDVRLVAGDPSSYNSTLKIDAEGNRIVDGVTSRRRRWLEGTTTVTVNDGRLTVSNGPGAVDNKVNFIIVTQRSTSTPDDTGDPDDMHDPDPDVHEPDPSVYPVGSPGTSEYRVRPTSEQPLVDGNIGAFRTVCDYSHMSKDDPIVFPGQPGAAHLHTFFGNTGADAHSTYQSLRSSGNSTCRGGIANRTAYWIPTLLGPGDVPLVPSESHFYYKSGYHFYGRSSVIQKIPSGLRIIAGDAKATPAAPQTDGVATWGCVNVYRGHHPQIIDCDVGDSIQLSVNFPQCWNGVDLDSPDHKSHLAFPTNGACPSSHPVVIPEISFHISWPRTAGMDISTLRLSSDMYSADLPGGYSAHADYFEAWDPGVRDAFTLTCVRQALNCHSHLVGDGRAIY